MLYENPGRIHAPRLGVNRYDAVKRIIEGVENSQKEELKELQKEIEKHVARADDRAKKAKDGADSIAKAASSTLKLPELASLEERFDREKAVAHTLGGSSNFIHVYHNLSMGILQAWRMLNEISVYLEVEGLITGDPEDDEVVSSRDRMHDLSAEYLLNQETCDGFVKGCMMLGAYRWQLAAMAGEISMVVERYHNALMKRHSVEGIKVYHAPILTDFAFTIYQNIAHHGEMTSSSTDTEISAHSFRKAESVALWIKDPEFKDILLSETTAFTRRFKEELWRLWKTASRIEKLFKDEARRVAAIFYKRFDPITPERFDRQIEALEDADPNQVKYKDLSASLTEDERHELQFKNDLLNKICRLLRDDDTSVYKLVREVWEDLKKLKTHYLEVNSFYVCRIAQGDPNGTGKSNGQLEVIPGRKPNANFEDIIGEGFDEVREFVEHIRRSRKWAPLYRITSPRKQAQKDNILLVGPQGCGKTECMRAICNEDDCIVIFASGSDFLTSWLGEAQKNPKRLVEAGVELQKESKLPVHILIDEIDEVLNHDRSTTNISCSMASSNTRTSTSGARRTILSAFQCQ